MTFSGTWTILNSDVWSIFVWHCGAPTVRSVNIGSLNRLDFNTGSSVGFSMETKKQGPSLMQPSDPPSWDVFFALLWNTAYWVWRWRRTSNLCACWMVQIWPAQTCKCVIWLSTSYHYFCLFVMSVYVQPCTVSEGDAHLRPCNTFTIQWEMILILLEDLTDTEILVSKRSESSRNIHLQSRLISLFFDY